MRPATIAFVLLAAGPLRAEGGPLPLIDERLELMRDEAAWRYARNAPVEDLAREAISLQRAMVDAQAIGLDPGAARAFFTAKNAAEKEIQSCFMHRWSMGEEDPPEMVPDMSGELRPRLFELEFEILDAILAYDGPPITAEIFFEAVAVDCLSPDTAEALRIGLTDFFELEE